MLTNVIAQSEGFLRLPRALRKDCLSLSLVLQTHFEIFELGTSNSHLTTRKKNEATEKSRSKRWRKRIVLTSLESLNTLGHKAAWLFESLSDVRKMFPLLLKLIWMAFLSFAMTRILPTTALYSDQLTWPSRIIFFLLMDSSHRKQDSCISEEDTQHNLLPLETIILLYCIRMSPVEV